MDTNQLDPVAALRQAVAKIGSQSATGRLLGVSQRAVWRWLAEKKWLPAEHVLIIERESGIPKEVLRPDIYPDESDRPTIRPDRTGPANPIDELAPAR